MMLNAQAIFLIAAILPLISSDPASFVFALNQNGYPTVLPACSGENYILIILLLLLGQRLRLFDNLLLQGFDNFIASLMRIIQQVRDFFAQAL